MWMWQELLQNTHPCVPVLSAETTEETSTDTRILVSVQLKNSGLFQPFLIMSCFQASSAQSLFSEYPWFAFVFLWPQSGPSIDWPASWNYWLILWVLGFLGSISGNEPTCQCRRCKRCGFSPWVGKIPWRRAWQPTPVFLPGESHGQRNLVGYSQ